MYLPHKTCSPEFRDQVAATLPGLGTNYAYWRLLEYVLFGTWVDEATGQLVLSAKQAAYLTGNERKWLSNHFALQPLLDDFSRDVFPVDTEGIIFNHYFEANQAGRIVADVPEWLFSAAKAERRRTGGKRVEFATGEQWTSRKSAKALRSIRAEAASLAASAGCMETQRLLKYLNGVAPNTFARIRRQLPTAHEVADEVGADVERQHNLLHAIEQITQPVYKPVENSTRVYTLNESFPRLKREVRDVLTKGWLKADLASAQLAIAATIWQAPAVGGFLISDRRIWDELQEWMKLPRSPKVKSDLKELMYSLLFGMSRKNLSAKARQMFPGRKEPWRRLSQHTVVNAMLEARQRQFATLRSVGFATDAFGRKLELLAEGRSSLGYQKDNASSILAQVAQSWELLLMLPILDLAESHRGTNGFTITMWLHDGVCINVHDARRIEGWKDRISSAVAEQAGELGIPTRLVWE